ncbi:MAG: hypothetical protein ACKOUM_12850, partial [Sphingopyxis sp.]
MTLLIKDPGSRIDYAFDWDADYLDGQAIALSNWAVVPDEAGGVAVAAHSHDLLRTTATLTGG